MASAALSSVPASDRHVWLGFHLSVYLAAPLANRDDAKRLEPWLSKMGTNAAIAILAVAMIRLIGFGSFLLVHLPITVLAASIGVWLFYVQRGYFLVP
jgi:hypothetical protein